MGGTSTIEVDNRGRAGLGKLVRPGTYKASTRDDGSVLLEPAQVLTEAEIAVLRNPELYREIHTTLDGTAESVELDWRAL